MIALWDRAREATIRTKNGQTMTWQERVRDLKRDVVAIGLAVLRLSFARGSRSLSVAFGVASALGLIAVPVYFMLATADFALRSVFNIGALGQYDSGLIHLKTPMTGVTPGQWARVLRKGAASADATPSSASPADALAATLAAMAEEADRIAREQA